MPRTTPREALETTHHLRAWRLAKGLTLEQLSEAIGMSNQNLGKIERGIVALSGEHHAPLARALDIELADLFRAPGDADRGRRRVPILGKVGADPEGRLLYSTGQPTGDTAPMMEGIPDAAALEVAGHSMRGVADDGSLVYFSDQRTPPSRDMLGHPVIVETVDGRILMKRLLKGSRPGVYDLESLIGDTMADVELRWAAWIDAIIPPRRARLIILRAHERQVA
jgi:transcriptional regulator with XRE-family HTH domain